MKLLCVQHFLTLCDQFLRSLFWIGWRSQLLIEQDSCLVWAKHQIAPQHLKYQLSIIKPFFSAWLIDLLTFLWVIYIKFTSPPPLQQFWDFKWQALCIGPPGKETMHQDCPRLVTRGWCKLDKQVHMTVISMGIFTAFQQDICITTWGC